MINTIFLDLDGVIINFVAGAARLNNINVEQAYRSIRYYEDLPRVMGLSKSEFWRNIESEKENFWVNLQPYPWAKSMYSILNRIAPVYILTSPDLSPYSASGKMMWIRKFFGPRFRKFIITQQKHLLAKEDTVLIDDKEQNVIDFKIAYGMAVLFPQPWNSVGGLDSGHIEHVINTLDSLV